MPLPAIEEPASNEQERELPTMDARAGPGNVALTVLAVLAAVASLKLAAVVFIPIVLAILISYALDPPVTLLARRAHIPRSVGATVLLTLLFVGVGAGGYALREDFNSLVSELPQVARRMGQMARAQGGEGTVNKVQQAAGEIEKAATAATATPAPPQGVTRVQIEEPPLKMRDYLVVGSVGMAGLAGQLVVVAFLALYLLASGDLFKRKLISIVGPSLTHKKITLQILQEIDRQIALFLLVRVAVSAAVAVATWIALELIGLEHAVLWGIAAGLLNTIPYLGPVIVAAATGVAGFMQFGTIWMTAVVATVTIVITSLEGYWLTPWLTSRAAEMNAVAIFVGLLFWGWLWGLWGMLLAVPMMMVIKAVCDRIEDLQPIGELLGD